MFPNTEFFLVQPESTQGVFSDFFHFTYFQVYSLIQNVFLLNVFARYLVKKFFFLNVNSFQQ